MKPLKKGNKGEDVEHLQALLERNGYPVDIDGIFGSKTQNAVRAYQKRQGLKIDGIVGPNTWTALEASTTPPIIIDFEAAAQTLNVEVAAIRAVHQVESLGSSGFLPDGRPEILFEGHIFWQQLTKLGINPHNHRTGNEDILFPEWDKSSYKGKEAEYTRLHRACIIHHQAALSSAAWGLFQIMGFNYKLCNYDSVCEFAAAMQLGMENHIKAFVSFLQNTGLDVLLREKNWAEFARRYNGPKYKENRYNERLEEAYMKI